MKKLLLIALMVLLVVSVSGCAEVAGAVVMSDKPRDTSPDATTSELSELVSGNSEFAFDLYQAIRGEEGNLFYSPYSISVALAMTYAGARNETEQQMADTMHFTLPQDQLHPAFNWLDLELAKRGEGAQGKDSEPFRLNIVNAIWGQKDYGFQDEFLDTLAENYGAGLRVLDFMKDAEKARVTINEWVADQTEDRIEDLIPEGLVDAMTRLVLTNAIYFNASWKHAFEEDSTYDGTFYLLDGSETTVPLMFRAEQYGYAEGDGYTAVELPYDGDELSMVVIMPDIDEFEAFETSLTAGRVAAIIGDIEYTQVALTMPKFEFESELNLSDTLIDMGMPIAFGAGADFSGMTGSRDLYISDVLHKAFVGVDEAGTEAAAATAVIMYESAAPEETEVRVDHPFMFLIRDIETEAILFVGRVMNPAA